MRLVLLAFLLLLLCACARQPQTYSCVVVAKHYDASRERYWLENDQHQEFDCDSLMWARFKVGDKIVISKTEYEKEMGKP